MSNTPKLIIVGSFLAQEKGVFGGVARSCQVLMESSFSQRFNIVPVDSTQISNPPPSFMVRSALALRRLIVFTVLLLKHRPDGVVLFASVGFSFIEKSLMAWIARLVGSRTFIFPRGGELIDQIEHSRLMYHLARFMCKGINHFLSQGPRWSDFAIKQLGFDPSHVHIIPNWTATASHLAIGSERDFVLISTLPKLLFVGWLEEFKGVYELLKVANNLHQAGYEFNLTLAGNGNAETDMKSYVEEHQLENVVIFAGWVEPNILANMMKESDIFVLPSWAEGLPNSMIEAMACGLAVVVSDVGMVSDYIQDQQHALVVPPKNMKALEQALRRMLDDTELRNKLAKNGCELAAKQFSVESGVARFGDIIGKSYSN